MLCDPTLIQCLHSYASVQKIEWELSRAWGRRRERGLDTGGCWQGSGVGKGGGIGMDTEFQCYKMKRALEMNGGKDYATG